MSPAGCNVLAHDEECLCDVAIGEPTVIEFDPTRFWGVRIAESAGFRWDEGPEKLLDLLEALAKAKDAAKNMASFDSMDKHGVARASKALHDDVVDWIGQGESIVDAPRQFKQSWGNVIAALTGGRPSELWTFSEQWWAEFEDWADTQDAVRYRAITREFNISRSSAQTLQRLYATEQRVARLHKINRTKEIIVQYPRQKPKFLRRVIHEETGWDITTDELGRLRAGLRRANKIPNHHERVTEFRSRMTHS